MQLKQSEIDSKDLIIELNNELLYLKQICNKYKLQI